MRKKHEGDDNTARGYTLLPFDTHEIAPGAELRIWASPQHEARLVALHAFGDCERVLLENLTVGNMCVSSLAYGAVPLELFNKLCALGPLEAWTQPLYPCDLFVTLRNTGTEVAEVTLTAVCIRKDAEVPPYGEVLPVIEPRAPVEPPAVRAHETDPYRGRPTLDWSR